MSERVRFIEHEGKKIFFLDLSGLKGEALLEVLREAREGLASADPEELRVLTDVTGAYFSKESKELSRDLVKPGGKGKSALVGITGVQRIIASAIFRDNYYAKSMDDAKAWLIE